MQPPPWRGLTHIDTARALLLGNATHFRPCLTRHSPVPSVHASRAYLTSDAPFWLPQTAQVVRSARLTKLAFNQHHPVLLVGDSKGSVTCLKLSPNLRRSSASSGGAAGSGLAAAAAPASGGTGAVADGVGSVGVAARARFETAEQQRLDAVLDVARKGRRAPQVVAAAAADGGAAA
jgi:hypothetical protein